MNTWQRFVKRSFDLCMAVIGLLVFSWLIIICWVLATIDTKQNGFFSQQRVGKNGRMFSILKIRTMQAVSGVDSVYTMRGDPRITPLGSVLRRYKLDELPQLINVLFGEMSFVGPRPDVVGFADQLQGEDRVILSVRPGITGPATLAFRNEEDLLANCTDPERFNREVLYLAKVKLNKEYLVDYSLLKDILYIIVTVLPKMQNWLMPNLKKRLQMYMLDK